MRRDWLTLQGRKMCWEGYLGAGGRGTLGAVDAIGKLRWSRCPSYFFQFAFLPQMGRSQKSETKEESRREGTNCWQTSAGKVTKIAEMLQRGYLRDILERV